MFNHHLNTESRVRRDLVTTGLFTVFVLYLRLSELVLGVVYVQRAQQLLHSLPAVHEGILRNRRRIQDAITEKTDTSTH